MGTPVSNFKNSFKVFSFEPMHVNLHETSAKSKAILIPVEDLTISQDFRPRFSEKDAYGRMDPIVTFQNVRRSLSINFKCQAHHIMDGPGGVVNNIRNINLLTQLLYPAYYETGTTINGDPLAVLGAPPFFKIRYGNYIGSFFPSGDFLGDVENGLTGYFNSFGHSLGTIAKNVAFGRQGKDKGYRALPREITVRANFQVVHDQLVGWYKNQFSPNGYGHNFPYNAGEFGKRGVEARSAGDKDPSGIQRGAGDDASVAIVGSTDSDTDTAAGRAAAPQSPQQQAKDGTTTDALSGK